MRGLRYLSVALLTILLTACTGHPNREGEATAINLAEQEIPGVERSSLVYANDILAGTRFELNVSMPDATVAQIRDVATLIHDRSGDRFDGYDVRLTIRVGGYNSVERAGAFDPNSVARDAEFVRRVATRVPSAITWSGTTEQSSVRVSDAEDPDAAIEAILVTAGDHPVTPQVSPGQGVSGPYWDVRKPISLALKHRIDDQLARMPGTPTYLTVDSNGINQLTVRLPDTATAYQDLVDIIGILGAGTDHPVWLTWRWDGDTAKGEEPDWSGEVRVGSCDYQGRRFSGNHTPEAAALEQRIRDEFDDCP